MSSAWVSGTLWSSRVSGPPGMRSTFTIFVLPTRAHSVRIWRTLASFATIVTRPFWSDSCTSADAVAADRKTIAAPKIMDFIWVAVQYTLRPDTYQAELHPLISAGSSRTPASDSRPAGAAARSSSGHSLGSDHGL